MPVNLSNLLQFGPIFACFIWFFWFCFVVGVDFFCSYAFCCWFIFWVLICLGFFVVGGSFYFLFWASGFFDWLFTGRKWIPLNILKKQLISSNSRKFSRYTSDKILALFLFCFSLGRYREVTVFSDLIREWTTKPSHMWLAKAGLGRDLKPVLMATI